MASRAEKTRFWQSNDLGGIELLKAQYLRQKFTPHVHDSFVFTVIETGAQRFHHRGAEHIAPAGSLVLINPDELHTGATAHHDGWQYRGFYPRVDQLFEVFGELDIRLSGTPAFTTSVLLDNAVASAFRHVHQLAELGAGALQLQTLWREATLMLFQRHARLGAPATAGKEPVAVSRAQHLLLSRLATPPSLKELAAEVNLSPFHFARVFRRTTGVTPHHWVMQRRLASALVQLRNGASVSLIAAELGFVDQSHLTRHFKRAYGVGPGAFRSGLAQ